MSDYNKQSLIDHLNQTAIDIASSKERPDYCEASYEQAQKWLMEGKIIPNKDGTYRWNPDYKEDGK